MKNAKPSCGVLRTYRAAAAEKDDNHHPHAGGQSLVNPRRSSNAEQIQAREERDEDNHEDRIGNFRKEVQRELAAQDRAHDGIEHVVHGHAPSRDITKRGMDLRPDIGERRAGAGISPSHLPVADRSKQHGHHRDEDGGDRMAVRALAHHSVNRHRRGRLDHDHAVENEVPKPESATETRAILGGRGLRFRHAVVTRASGATLSSLLGRALPRRKTSKPTERTGDPLPIARSPRSNLR